MPELIEFATTIMTLNSGDLISCGTNHEGLGPLQDGEVCDFEIEKVGRMTLHVRDPLQARVGARHLHGPELDEPGGAAGGSHVGANGDWRRRIAHSG